MECGAGVLPIKPLGVVPAILKGGNATAVTAAGAGMECDGMVLGA